MDDDLLACWLVAIGDADLVQDEDDLRRVLALIVTVNENPDHG